MMTKNKLDLNLMMKQIIIGGVIFLNENKTDGIPISIQGYRGKSIPREVWKYIKQVTDEEFEDILNRVKTTHEYVPRVYHSRLKATNYTSNPQRQRETLMRIKYPLIFDLEEKYNESMYKIVSNLRLNLKRTVDEISTSLNLPSFIIEAFIKNLTKDKRYFVRSQEEKVVADFLHDNSLHYEYEPERFYYYKERYYVPDFYLPDYNCYIEYFGYYGKEYEEKAQEKVEFYESLEDYNFIYLYPEDLRDLTGGIIHKLK